MMEWCYAFAATGGILALMWMGLTSHKRAKRVMSILRSSQEVLDGARKEREQTRGYAVLCKARTGGITSPIKLI